MNQKQNFKKCHKNGFLVYNVLNLINKDIKQIRIFKNKNVVQCVVE